MPRGKKNTDTNGANTTARDNTPARADLIRNVCRELKNMDEEIAQLQAARSQYKQKHIKGDLGMKMADFNMAYRLYGLEGDDRDELLDTIRETFEALGQGEQLDWLKVSERANSSAMNQPSA